MLVARHTRKVVLARVERQLELDIVVQLVPLRRERAREPDPVDARRRVARGLATEQVALEVRRDCWLGRAI